MYVDVLFAVGLFERLGFLSNEVDMWESRAGVVPPRNATTTIVLNFGGERGDSLTPSRSRCVMRKTVSPPATSGYLKLGLSSVLYFLLYKSSLFQRLPLGQRD